MKFNGVSIFANHRTGIDDTIESTSPEAIFNAQSQALSMDNTMTIHTSADGPSGSKVSLHKSYCFQLLL